MIFFLFILACFETESRQPKLNLNSIYIYHVCTYMWTHVVACMWISDDDLHDVVILLLHVSPRDQAQIIRLDRKHAPFPI